MAFTDANKASVLEHLNYPLEAWAVTTVTNQFNKITALGADFETQVTDTLTELDTVKADIATYTTTDAGVQVKDGQVNYAQLPLIEKKNRYRTLQINLAKALGLAYSESSKIIRG